MKKTIFILMLAASFMCHADMAKFYFENDFPFDQDDDYTHGTRIEYEHGRYALFIEQLMYSPEEIDVPYQEGWHPYAGYLGIGGSVTLDERIEDRLVHLNYLELQTGIVGPASGAEGTQKLIHSLVGAHRPVGWDDQLKNEWQVQGILLTGYEYILCGRASGWNIRVSDQIGAHLGTMQIAAENRAVIKLGYGNDYDRHISNIETREAGNKWGWLPNTCYFLLGNETKWWNRNIFLDGNNTRDSVSVEKEIWTTGIKYGLVAEFNRFECSVFVLHSTDEYKSQRTSPTYMSFQLGYLF